MSDRLSSRPHGALTPVGLVAWLLVGAPVLLRPGEDFGVLLAWLLAFGLFGAAFAFTRRSTGWLQSALLVVQPLAVASMALLLCDGLEGTLLVLVAVELGLLCERRVALPWILVQSSLLTAAVWIHWSPHPALLLLPPYLGFQLLSYFVLEALRRETEAHRRLEKVNAELLETRPLLAEHARLAERLHISRELHDAMGHHLVALRLNLEALAAKASGGDNGPLDTALTLVKLLHNDVEDMVKDLEESDELDLLRALEALKREIPKPRVHLDLGDVPTSDPQRAQALLRCCQEIVTNTVKHADAENLWIRLGRTNSSILLQARDDGRGAWKIVPGHGLEGMRRRLSELDGRIEYRAAPGGGFELEAVLPLRSGR